MKRTREEYEEDMVNAGNFLKHPDVLKLLRRQLGNAMVEIWDSPKIQDLVDFSSGDVELEIIMRAIFDKYSPMIVADLPAIAKSCVDKWERVSAELVAETYKDSDPSEDDEDQSEDESDEDTKNS